MKPARRARSGRHSAKSSATERAAVASMPSSVEATHPEPQRAVERVGGESAERHEVSVREVDEPQDPVDERDTDRSDRDHRSRDEPFASSCQNIG